jgi:hypothetical protein
MDPAHRATPPSSRGSRTGINDELLAMVEHEVRGWPGACKEQGSDDLGEQTDPITATLAA